MSAMEGKKSTYTAEELEEQPVVDNVLGTPEQQTLSIRVRTAVSSRKLRFYTVPLDRMFELTFKSV